MTSGVWYRTLVYLGLKEEPEEGYDDLPERVVGHDGDHDRFDPVDDPDAVRGDHVAATTDSNVRPLRVAEPAPALVLGGVPRLAVVEVGVFDDVEDIGSRYRTGQPVVFDVGAADAATARRVVDFVSGLTYALRGRMRKVGVRAFLLVPDGVELPHEELDRLASLGYRIPSASDA
jgi:cell division inhibitor SepF